MAFVVDLDTKNLLNVHGEGETHLRECLFNHEKGKKEMKERKGKLRHLSYLVEERII